MPVPLSSLINQISGRHVICTGSQDEPCHTHMLTSCVAGGQTTYYSFITPHLQLNVSPTLFHKGPALQGKKPCGCRWGTGGQLWPWQISQNQSSEPDMPLSTNKESPLGWNL